jgi:hypothetical protein
MGICFRFDSLTAKVDSPSIERVFGSPAAIEKCSLATRGLQRKLLQAIEGALANHRRTTATTPIAHCGR